MLAILDYEAGNQTSVLRALRSLDIPAGITADREALAGADGVVFPGVGAAKQAMDLLRRTGLDMTLRELVHMGMPLLGICLGCQILLEDSEESHTKALGIIRGCCKRFDESLHDEAGEPITIPHMGWNSCASRQESRLLEGIPPDAEFYFVHGYYVVPDEKLVIAATRHGMEFCSIYGRDGLWGAQFHPEKSGRPGLRLLRNFYSYCREEASRRS